MPLKYLLLPVEILQSCCSLCHAKFKCRIARNSHFSKESNIINSYVNFLFFRVWQLIKFLLKTCRLHLCLNQNGPQNIIVGSQITRATHKLSNFQKHSTLLPCPMCFLPICCPFLTMPNYCKFHRI